MGGTMALKRVLSAGYIFVFAGLFIYMGTSLGAVETGRSYLSMPRAERPDQQQFVVYTIELPNSVAGDLFIRIFDADIGGQHDRTASGAEARYRVFAQEDSLPLLTDKDSFDTLPSPLVDIAFKDDMHRDNSWYTLVKLQIDSSSSKSNTFSLIVESSNSLSKNVYDVSVSSSSRRNEAVPGVTLSTRNLWGVQPSSTDQVTEIRFLVPEQASVFDIKSFATSESFEAVFQSKSRAAFPVSIGIGTDSTRIPLLMEEKGELAALVVKNMGRKIETFGFEVLDQSGNRIPILLPVRFAQENSVPVPTFSVTSLTDCFSALLDAGETQDADGDELSYIWTLDGKEIGKGIRLIHQFEGPGSFNARLVVSDHSGFVANSAYIESQINISAAPNATFTSPATAIPGEMVSFDASESSDTDGNIVRYDWDFGGLAHAEGSRVEYAFPKAGTYTVTPPAFATGA